MSWMDSKQLPVKLLVSLCVATACAGMAQAQQVLEAPAEAADQTDRMIIKYRGNGLLVPEASSNSASLRGRLASEMGVAMSQLRRTGLGADVMQLNKAMSVSELKGLAAKLMAEDSSIEYAEPDRKMYALLTPNDTNFSSLWGMGSGNGGIRATTAWDTTNGAGVTVAVLDTGIRSHSDLNANLVAGYDMIADVATANDGNGRDSDGSDPGDWNTAGQCGTGSRASNSSWHGTHVAGTIAAVGNNGAGVIGVAYGAKVQSVRVLGRCGGYTSDIADGMIWASGGTVSGLPANATPSKVLNLSLGGSGACDTTTQNAINSARSRGATVVIAAGNSNVNVSNASPANCAGVIAVAAVGPTGGKASYSNFGTLVGRGRPRGRDEQRQHQRHLVYLERRHHHPRC